MEKAKAVFEPVWAKYQHVAPRSSVSRSAHSATTRRRATLIKKMKADSGTDPYLIFLAYYGLKDYDSALEWLRRAIDDRNASVLQFIRLPNMYPGLREQPGYAEVLKHLDSLQRSP